LVVLFTSDKVDKSRYPEKIGLRKQSMANWRKIIGYLLVSSNTKVKLQ
jgi:hypothetical protein